MKLLAFCLASVVAADTNDHICRDGFEPTNGMAKTNSENHCSHPNHGVVCRRNDGSGHWYPPATCTKKLSSPYALAADGKPCRAGCWDVLTLPSRHSVTNKQTGITTDTFPAFQTTAIRFQRTNLNKRLNGHWFRVNEITIYDDNDKRVMPAGARSDNYHRAWRNSNWAPELYDYNENWGNDAGVHFQNYVTLWFHKEVTVAKLQVKQGSTKQMNYNWMWLSYAGGNFLELVDLKYPKPASHNIPSGWSLVKENDQGALAKTVDIVQPFTTTAIRFDKARSGNVKGSWFRVTEINVFDAANNIITPAGARTDDYHGAWRQSVWAPELFDDNENWANDAGVHFKNTMIMWFSGPVTIAKLEVVQASFDAWHRQMMNSNWRWLKFTAGQYADAFDTACEGAFTEWSACSKSCGGGNRVRTYQVTKGAVANGAACPHANEHIDEGECNADVECPVPVDVEMIVNESVESFTETKQQNMIDAMASQLGIDASRITLTVGVKANPIGNTPSRRLTAGLLVTFTIEVLPSKVVEEIEKLESVSFAEAILEETQITATFQQFKPAKIEGEVSSICATCEWKNARIVVTHYINAQTHGTQGLQHRCYHVGDKCKCKCATVQFTAPYRDGEALNGRLTPNGPSYGTPGLNWDGN